MKISCMAKPFYIGNVQIKNRFAVTAMVTNMCDAGGYATEQYIRYHEAKAKGGYGLIITEDYAVNANAGGYARVARIYKEDGDLKELSAEERLEQRKIKVKPLVEAYFAWVREQLSSGRSLPKGKTADGLNYCLNHERYLKVFLTDGNVPIDNSAAERAVRPFCVGKKNWMFFNTVKGAEASSVAYSIAESAKANNLKPYPYFKHLLSELPDRMDENGNIDPSTLDDLMPWAEGLPEECYKRR